MVTLLSMAIFGMKGVKRSRVQGILVAPSLSESGKTHQQYLPAGRQVCRRYILELLNPAGRLES